MAKPIYKVFLVRTTEAFHQLSKEEQNSLLAQVSAARDAVGGKVVAFCDSSWSSELWPVFGVEVFPDIEAVQKHAALLAELNWYRYIESLTALGTDLINAPS